MADSHDDPFADLDLDSFEETSASPRVEIGKFVGIKVTMPARVVVGATEKLPVCGTWVLPGSVYARHREIADQFVWMIRDLATHEPRSGNFQAADHPYELPNREKGEPPHPESRVMGWFNFDLCRVWKVPDRPGRYRLVVILDEFASNDCDFEVVEP